MYNQGAEQLQCAEHGQRSQCIDRQGQGNQGRYPNQSSAATIWLIGLDTQ